MLGIYCFSCVLCCRFLFPVLLIDALHLALCMLRKYQVCTRYLIHLYILGERGGGTGRGGVGEGHETLLVHVQCGQGLIFRVAVPLPSTPLILSIQSKFKMKNDAWYCVRLSHQRSDRVSMPLSFWRATRCECPGVQGDCGSDDHGRTGWDGGVVPRAQLPGTVRCAA